METTRRQALGIAAGGMATLAWPGAAVGRRRVGLPTGRQLRRDIQHMVDLGPRFTGTAGHDAFIDWLEAELVAAGVVMLPRDEEKLTVWEASGFGLEVDGTAQRVATYYPRSQETGPAGVSGPLVHAATGGSLAGAIALVDLPMPTPLTTGFLLPLVTYLHWPGHSDAEFATGDYKRPWIAPGVSGVPTAPYAAQGAVGCVFVLDAPYEALRDNYIPFENGFEELPALFVDRDTGAALRAKAGAPAKLTLEASRHEGTSPALLGYLPGTKRRDEALILDSHTDGEGFVEENGGIGMVALARHFGSLPRAKRLERTLVFSLWPGHMATGMPQLQGVIDKHPDIVRSAAAAITVEHLGCSEWIDTADKGYHATGEAEALGVWTTQGKVFDITKAATIKHDIPHAALLRPPVQFGVGGAFQTSGVPQVGFLAGPYYLLSNAPGGDMDKLDAELAAKQVAWTATMLRAFDAVPMEELAAGDPTLGTKPDAQPATYPPRKPLRLRLRRGTIAVNRPAVVRYAVRRRGRRIAHGRRLVRHRFHVPVPKGAVLTVRAEGRVYHSRA
ncbi:MAG: hypothetical protein QOI80_3508 [Solirubrobacteraceae bacterium]|nr:hypothetical protein [Solirubrobacteraceae bacterium]